MRDRPGREIVGRTHGAAATLVVLVLALAGCNEGTTPAQTGAIVTSTPAATRSTETASPTPSETPSTPTATSTPARPSSGIVVVAGVAFPSRSLTPGSAFASATRSKVCASGYTKSVRDVTDEQRHAVFAAYGIRYAEHTAYELDHLIPLELGGNNANSNLWPQPYASKQAGHKDLVENKLHNLVCSGSLGLSAAQHAIAVNWFDAYREYGGATYATSAPSPRPTHRTITTPPPPPPGTTSALDPRFGTCKEAKAHGYGPYYRGKDPEYYWYRDADHDGIDCE